MSALPITTKTDLRAQPLSDILARGVDPARVITHVTSGSSGEPFQIRRTWLDERVFGAFRRRALTYYGMRATDRYGLVGLARPPPPCDQQVVHPLAQSPALF